MYPAQERNCIQHHCYGAQGFLVTEEGILVTEDKVCFFVYRLVLDAKPDRGMM